MKKHISAVLVLALVLTTLLAGVGAPALAASVSFSVTPGVTELLKGGDVKFSFSIENTDAVQYDDCIIKYGDYEKSIGNVPASPDGSVSGDFTMNVSDSMLGQSLTFKLVSGDLEVATATAKVNKKTPSVNLSVSVSANKEIADEGETVTFTFKLQNKGEADISDIVVKAPSLNSGKALKDKFTLAAGSDSYTFTYKYTMTSGDVKVTPTISYTANGADQTPITKDPITVTLSKRDVKVVLSADNDHPQPGEEVTFTLKVTNNGNVSYSHMKVSLNGEEVEFPTSRLKPGDDPSQTYKRTFETSSEVSFTITMEDQNGEQKSVTSNAIQVVLPVDSAVVNDKLKLSMDVDRPQLTSAGTVNFSGYVTNATEYELQNVQVNEASLGNIYSVSSLESGGQDPIQWSADINETTTYNFVLTATDRDGNNYTINADPITVSVQSVEPTPTNFEDAPDVTESGQVLDTGKASFDWSKFFLILAIVLVVLIIGVGAALFVLWKKGKSGGGRPSGGRPSGGRPSSGRPAPRPSSSSTARKPSSSSYGRGSGPRKPTGPKSSYRDRNNF